MELGANNGILQSNTLYLELFEGWRGLLIEPIQRPFEELRNNRNLRQNVVMRFARVGFEYRRTTVEMVYSNLMSTAIGVDTDTLNPTAHAKAGLPFLAPGVQIWIVNVPAISLTEAMVLAQSPRKIGLLSLDVEGSELEVLKGLDFHNFQFG